jgi:hypothetical protein
VALPPKDDIERTLREIVGVEAVRVCLAGEGIAELHIAASPGSRAKNVMRDVRSCLAAVLGIEVDHKKISIAVRKSPGGHPETPSGEGEGMRVRFHSVSVLIEGLQTEVQVRLAAQGRDLLGCASGIPVGFETERLVARATLEALQCLLPEDERLLAGDLSCSRVGSGEVMVAEVLWARGRGQQRLIGACPLEADRLRSAVFATLDALNRILAKLAPSGWTEVRVEPEAAEKEREEAQG